MQHFTPYTSTIHNTHLTWPCRFSKLSYQKHSTWNVRFPKSKTSANLYYFTNRSDLPHRVELLIYLDNGFSATSRLPTHIASSIILQILNNKRRTMLPGTIRISPAHPAYYTVSSLAYPRRRGFILSSVTTVRARDEEKNGPAGWEKRQRWSFISALYSNHTNYCFFLVSHCRKKQL